MSVRMVCGRARKCGLVHTQEGKTRDEDKTSGVLGLRLASEAGCHVP
jgi:hypothetical protein